jgi:hypothetical protein
MHGLSGRAPVLQAQNPEFKPHYHQKTKQKILIDLTWCQSQFEMMSK